MTHSLKGEELVDGRPPPVLCELKVGKLQPQALLARRQVREHTTRLFCLGDI
jgi:hypothetical protein